MDILTAYKEEHREEPTRGARLWWHNLDVFTTGWNAALDWKEEHEPNWDTNRWKELLEIEADVLYQQEGLTRGE